MKIRIAGIIVLIVGAMLSVLVIASLWHDIPVWFFGRKVHAVIEDSWWEDLDLEKKDRANLYLNYYIQYKFKTMDGEVVVGTSKVTQDEFMGYHPGNEIVIKYSIFNPDDNRVDDSRFVPFLVCSYIPVLLICIFIIISGKEMVDF